MKRTFWLCILVVFCFSLGFAQLSTTATPPGAVNGAVPTLVNVSGTLTDVSGKPLTGIVGVTFYLYKDEQGVAPLWMETQNVQTDKSGRYTVMLGSTTSQGLPTDVFFSGEARWLGVQAQGQAEQPRVLLLSVPYALKAGDAQTVGGLPPSAFMLSTSGGLSAAAASNPATAGSPNSAPPAGTVTGSGTVNFLPIWTGTSTIGNSVLFQSGTGSTAKVGINTTTPASTLDVKGGGTIRGLFSLPATGTATATKGANSQPQTLVASSYNSGTRAAVNQTFQWQAEPAANNTSSPAGTLNLLSGAGTAKPTETGLHIASNGKITFASGQAFPGVVGSVTAGIDLTNSGTSSNPILNVDATKVPQLKAANTFTGNQTITGNLSDTGNIAATGFVSGNAASFTNYISSSGTITSGGSVSSGGNVVATGAGLGVFMGNVGCSAPTIGIQSTGLTANCQNFILGFNGSQNDTYINRPAGGNIHFREGNGNDQVSIVSGGQVGIGGQISGAGAMLEVHAPFDSVLAGGVFEGSSSSMFGLGGTGGIFQGGCGTASCGDGIGADSGPRGGTSVYAGEFGGDVDVTGRITAGR